MNINRNNYEIYFLDYLDGTLDSQMVQALMAFLNENPDLREELDGLEQCRIIKEAPIHFDEKDKLKKQDFVSAEKIEETIIAFYEGDLSQTETEILLATIDQNPEYEKLFNTFSKTILNPEREIVFDRKDLLRKPLGATSREMELAEILESGLPLHPEMNNNAELQREFEVLGKTKVEADTTIVFENKRSLKKFEISAPIVWRYIAVAASIALLFGLFFLLRPESAQNKNCLSSHKRSFNPAINLSLTHSDTNSVIQKKQHVIKNFVLETNIINNNSNQLAGVIEYKYATPRKAKIENEKRNISPLKEVPVDPNYFINEEPIANNNSEPNNKDLNIGTFLFHKAAKALSNEPSEAADITKNRRKLNFWDFAFLGVKGYNRVFNKDVKLHPSYDDNGNLSAVDFRAGKLAYSRTFNK